MIKYKDKLGTGSDVKNLRERRVLGKHMVSMHESPDMHVAEVHSQDSIELYSDVGLTTFEPERP